MCRKGGQETRTEKGMSDCHYFVYSTHSVLVSETYILVCNFAFSFCKIDQDYHIIWQKFSHFYLEWTHFEVSFDATAAITLTLLFEHQQEHSAC